ncbi:response regulator [Chamaesiphon sp. VAR_48_metabat_135_sub]|uniref:response regulator n=1 Tax=Chamaesiphon sp. VAR_48_metabat_135_sub TaxID=2964699 RepID=UPI00286AAFE4|nr:response regulator [Chamaesiphon sp. VAR_48_metabat_135_sub]
MKILLIEDDDTLIALLTRSLSSQHHIVDAVKDGEMGWTYASTFDYDAIVLDIMLPKLDGISLCKKLRGAGCTTPILLLTAQDNTTAKVQGLDAGADDYVVKPFDLAELTARVRALLRRGSTNPLPLLSWGDLMLNPSSCEVSYNGQPLALTTKEYDLLELFLRDSYRVFSNDEIIDRLWSSDDFPAEATVRSHLRRLRHKLQSAGAPHDFIGTIHGRGYYLTSPQNLPQSLIPSNHLAGAIYESPLPNDCDFHPINSNQQQAEYLAFLQETWVKTKPQCLENVAEIAKVVDRILLGNSNYPEQQQAHQKAHKLVGTLGVFSLVSSMEIARQIERLLNRSILLSPAEASPLQNYLSELTSAIESRLPSQKIDVPSPDLPLLLLIDLDPTLTQSLTEIAENNGCRSIALPTIEAADRYLFGDSNPYLPTLILVNLRDTSSTLNFIHNVHLRLPDRVILGLSDRDESIDRRLAVVRHGGKFLCTTNLTTEQIFTAATSLIPSITTTPKVMIVDDDLDWLRTIPKLLQPWGLKITTLADPQQFWSVLQSVRPDAIVLDVQMPEINGLELCQVLRSDPQWQSLPILFLSASKDSIDQQEAFKVGADDYLCKPMMGGELAQRIRHRLARLHARSATRVGQRLEVVASDP